MSSVASATAADVSDPPSTPNIKRSSSDSRTESPPYLIRPAFDLFFVANLYWPLLFAVCWFSSSDVRTGVLFWQVYFITAPHRWVTLLLVATDRNRTRGREWLFFAVGAFIVGSCCVLRFGTGSLLCLGAVDYVWNAWHFAAQHHGIYRIYQRREGLGEKSKRALLWQKILMRCFLVYVTARVAGIGWHVGSPDWTWHLKTLDPWVAVAATAMLVGAAVRMVISSVHRMSGIYLLSVMILFLSMLWAAHAERRQLVLQLALASAVFHSIEYMAVVTWASTTQKQRARGDIVGRMARQWTLFLAYFVVFLGLTNYLIASGYQQLWITVNLVVAFLHYAYDGMIWKARRQSSGQAG